MSQKSKQGWLYLLHFKPAYWHAQHYLGFAQGRKENAFRRVDRHRAGRGANLTHHAVRIGVELVLAELWPGTRRDERKLKRKSRLAALCPVCQLERKLQGLKPRRK